MIGTFGTALVFEVSDSRVLTFNEMTREVSGRWTDHEVMGVKPKPEFLGPGSQTVSLPITLSSSLGVRPRQMLERVADLVERGQAEYLIINCKPVSKNPFRITGSSETWNTLYSGGELALASLTLTLEEYT